MNTLHIGAAVFIVLSMFNTASGVEKNSNYKNLDPQVAQFLSNLAKNDGPPIYTLPVEQARKVLDDLQAGSVGTIPADIKDITIKGGPTKEVSVRLIRPQGSKGILPAVVYVHGGGWILGNKNTHDRLVRQIANHANVVVAFINYTPSPEAQYPVPTEQIYSAASYLAKNAAKYQIDPKRMAIAGDSVGGLMATVVAQLAKQRGGPAFVYQLLFYPVTDADFNTQSYNKFADGYWLSKKAMKWFWDAYAPHITERSMPTVSPLRASIKQLHGLPPALIITDENDVLLDEGKAYAEKLQKAGVNTEFKLIKGTVHDFAMLDPLKDTAPTKDAIAYAVRKLKKALYSN
ncbi:MAG TPA: alpha/beta hydrolase [Candidatus Babeliales bacterium]|nr:alpha/beta hydrolase [Candidatus Babeliales bacterium]